MKPQMNTDLYYYPQNPSLPGPGCLTLTPCTQGAGCVRSQEDREAMFSENSESRNQVLLVGVQLESGSQAAAGCTQKTNNESDMECGDLSDLSPLSFLRRGHSGDKSPHSKRAVIVRMQLTKAAPGATA